MRLPPIRKGERDFPAATDKVEVRTNKARIPPHLINLVVASMKIHLFKNPFLTWMYEMYPPIPRLANDQDEDSSSRRYQEDSQEYDRGY